MHDLCDFSCYFYTRFERKLRELMCLGKSSALTRINDQIADIEPSSDEENVTDEIRLRIRETGRRKRCKDLLTREGFLPKMSPKHEFFNLSKKV